MSTLRPRLGRAARAVLDRTPPARFAVAAWYHRGVEPADVFLASYPKSGNTWLRFMLAQVMSGDEVDFDSVGRVVPDISRHRWASVTLPDGGRLIKTHEPFHPSYVDVRAAIVIVRDGRDVALSLWRHLRREGSFDGTFDAFLPRFLRGNVTRFGSWQHHVASWRRASALLPVLELRYEDVLAAPEESLRRAAAHIGVPLTPVEAARVVAANDVGRMQAKEPSSRYLRSRAVGDATLPFVRAEGGARWQGAFDEQQLRAFDDRAGAALAALGYPRMVADIDG